MRSVTRRSISSRTTRYRPSFESKWWYSEPVVTFAFAASSVTFAAS
jgi:hypothetical protein